MSGQSLTTIISGPAIINYRGATFRSKGDITLENALDVFPIVTSLLGQVDARVSERPVRFRFEPDGEWSSLAVLYPYALMPFGQYVTPQMTLGNIAGNVCVVDGVGNNGVISGDSVFVGALPGATLPTGLAASTLYYIHLVSNDSISFHTNYADAVAGTNAIAISNGTGLSRFVVNNALTIQTQAGELYTFPNVAVVQMPNIHGSTVNTLLREVIFEAFIRDGEDWTAVDNPYYTINQNSPWPGDYTFSSANILTQPIIASWGNSDPWSSFNTKDGWEVSFAMALEPIVIDNVGLITRKFMDLKVTARATPVGVDSSDVLTALKMQGAGSSRGRSLSASGKDLNLSAAANNFYCRLFGAGLVGGPHLFSLRVDRIGALEWQATRTVTNGITNPLFYVGTATVT